MQGEYRGDFTRDTFDPSKHFSRVLMQQGRVILDEDWNEQAAILLYYLRTLATDLIGPNWGPKQIEGADNAGFVIGTGANNKEVSIGPGRYYVNGILCENNSPISYTAQDDFPLKPEEKELKGTSLLTYLVYLDVWERHISALEDGSIREVALGGPDTSTRARVVWQVKLDDLTGKENARDPAISSDIKTAAKNLINAPENDRRAGAEAYLKLLADKLLQPETTGRFRARARKKDKPGEPCAISPESRYRGVENHLYRVEIHKTGPAWDKQMGNNRKPAGNIEKAATFKWSRDNGSIVFPIRSLTGSTVTLAHLGRDVSSSLQVDDYVEVVDDTLIRRGEAGPLRQVGSVDPVEMSVTLKDGPGTLPSYEEDDKNHPLLRRWDHRDDGLKQTALALKEGTGEEDSDWIELEDGIQIQFPVAQTNTYRSGDYWLIPARVASGDVEWPTNEQGIEESQSPHGIEHHYAPLWMITVDPNGIVAPKTDCRRLLP